MGKYTPVILLGAAIVIALLTSTATYNWLKGKRQVGKVQTVETEPVCVALIDIAWGAKLNKEMIRVESFKKGSLPAGSFFADPAQLEGRVALSSIGAREPIFKSRLAPESLKEGGVPAVVKAGKRAMAVKVDKVSGVSGFVKPGNKVDVLVTVGQPEGGGRITKIVLENMPVLASGTQMEQTGQGTAPTPVDVITLEVTPEEAEKLALAATEGRIQMALRGHTDSEEVWTKGETVSTLLESFHLRKGEQKPVKVAVKAAPPVRKAPPPRAWEPTYNVWVVNGPAVKGDKISGGE